MQEGDNMFFLPHLMAGDLGGRRQVTHHIHSETAGGYRQRFEARSNSHQSTEILLLEWFICCIRLVKDWHAMCFCSMMAPGYVIQLVFPISILTNIPIHITSTIWSNTIHNQRGVILYYSIFNCSTSSQVRLQMLKVGEFIDPCCWRRLRMCKGIRVQPILRVIFREYNIFCKYC